MRILSAKKVCIINIICSITVITSTLAVSRLLM